MSPKNALSIHAEEAYEETGSERGKRNAERIFRALTDTFTDPRGVRRPTSVADLAAICEVPEAEVNEVVEVFRRPNTQPGSGTIMVQSTYACMGCHQQ